MLIQTENTPNPNVIKFYPDCTVMEKGTADFKTMDQAMLSPLARRLFAIEGVCGVFLGSDYVAVTKAEDKLWPRLKPLILGGLMDCFLSGVPVQAKAVGKTAPVYDKKDPIIKQIIAVLDAEIKPFVAGHGGHIEFHSFINGVVYVDLQGACAGCPAASLTLKGGVERTLRQHVPEVNEVREVVNF